MIINSETKFDCLENHQKYSFGKEKIRSEMKKPMSVEMSSGGISERVSY